LIIIQEKMVELIEFAVAQQTTAIPFVEVDGTK